MDNEQEAAEELFGEALDVPREQRAAFLDEACRDAPEVRRVVEALLCEDDRLSGYLSESPYIDTDAAAAGRPARGMRLGRYVIEDEIGAGGMGVVYRARDEKLERVVAIKMLPRDFPTDEEVRRYFRREALALAKLNHGHIAAVYDVVEQDGADSIVMELVEGEPLAAKLRAGPLEVYEAVAIARQVADALEEAHAHGVIHRDLKPANVMITPKGDAKVLDFGVAKLLAPGRDAQMTETEMRVAPGTPLYMSPEQALGRNVDARTDLWSLGALLYEMVTGCRAFPGGTPAAIFDGILHQMPKPPSQLNARVPAVLDGIIDKLLEKDRELRYQGAAEVRADLARLKRDMDAGVSVPRARAASYPVGTGSWRGKGLLAYLVLGLAVMVLAMGGWFAYRTRRARMVVIEPWPQRTNLRGSVVQPVLSPNGRILAFIRWPNTFLPPGEVYVEPLPPEHDGSTKRAARSFANEPRIAHSRNHRTRVVPLVPVKPQALLPNGEGLNWADPQHAMYLLRTGGRTVKSPGRSRASVSPAPGK